MPHNFPEQLYRVQGLEVLRLLYVADNKYLDDAAVYYWPAGMVLYLVYRYQINSAPYYEDRNSAIYEVSSTIAAALSALQNQLTLIKK